MFVMYDINGIILTSPHLLKAGNAFENFSSFWIFSIIFIQIADLTSDFLHSTLT